MKKWFLAATILISSAAWAEGHSVGNGGGVICIAGKCKTLIEAGLELNPEFDGVWLPTSTHIGGIQTLVSKLPFHHSIQKSLEIKLMGRLDHFRKAEIVDPIKLEAIKKQYIDLAADAGFKIDPATFELVAFSSDDTITPALTYILPKFFELDPAQQLEFLLHEGLYRGQPTNKLRYVLQFENAAGYPSVLEKKINLQIAGYHLGILSKHQLLGHLLLTASADNNSTGFPEPSFRHDLYGSMESGTIFQFDLNKILDAGRLENRLPYILSKMNSLKFVQNRMPDRELLNCEAYQFRLDSNGSLAFCGYKSYPGNAEQFFLSTEVDFELVLPK